MKFSCALETASDSIRLSKVVSFLIKSGYRLMSQRQEASKNGGHIIFVVAEGAASSTQDQIVEDLTGLEGCTLLKIRFAESKAGVKKAVVESVAVTDQQSVLANIGEQYPKIVPIVKAYSASLDDASRKDRLRELGYKVGAGIYQRDFALGSPLKLPKTLSRELRPALKKFCDVENDEQSIVLMGCPFCASDDAEAACCEFVSGYISGFLSSNPAVGDCQAIESRCGSGGTKDCTFRIDG